MLEGTTKRKYAQQKQAFHNAAIAIPFFISNVPTKVIALKKQRFQTDRGVAEQKLYYNGSKFIKTKIISFESVDESKQYFERYQQSIKKSGECRQWIEYCKDISGMQNILFQYGKIYVIWFESKELRELINDVSQAVVFHGLFMEQHIKRTNNPLFRFLDNKVLSLEYIYYRWRAYAYLQSDGQKKYRTQPFRIISNGIQWFPPFPSSLQRAILTYKQRKYFTNLIIKLGRKKHDIQEAMVFAISHMNCAIEVVIIIVLQIFEKIKEDFIKYFYLISDILFNTTTQDYRRLFSRMIPFVLYQLGKDKAQEANSKEKDNKFKGELKSLIQLWEIKFIFDQNYTKGLIFLLNSFEANNKKCANGIHQQLKKIACIEDDDQSQYEIEKLCFQHGIPFLQNDKEESTKLINEYLWQHAKVEQRMPQINENVDGQPIVEKDLIKIKNKQVKVVTCQGLSVNMLLQKNWQTKGRVGQSSSVDHQ